MAKPITIPNIFQNQTGPIPLSQLDADFTTASGAVNDFATYSNGVTDTGTVNAMVVTILSPLTFAYTAFITLDVLVSNTTTSTAPTINVNSLGAKTITTMEGGVLAPGALVSGGIYRLIYDGTNFRVQSHISAYTAVTVAAATGSITINSTTATNAANVFYQLGGVAKARLGVEGTAGATITGSAAGDLYAYTTGGSFLISPNSGAGAAVKVASAGNVTIAAPTAGTTLTVTGVGGGTTLLASGAGTGSGPMLHLLQNTTSTGYTSLRLYNDIGTSARALEIDYSGSGYVGSLIASGPAGESASISTTGAFPLVIGAGNTARMVIGSSGNIVINAPASGIALTVGGSGTSAFVTNQLQALAYVTGQDAFITTYDGTIQSLWGSDGTQVIGGAFSSHALKIRTSNVDRIVLAAAGNATINAASSGVTLTISGLTGQYSQVISGSTTGNGLYVGAGSTSGQNSLLIQNGAQNQNYFLVRGDGLTEAVDDGGTLQIIGWRGTPYNLQNSAYQFVLADRGKSVVCSVGSPTYTVPANVFSAGDVVTVVAASGGTVSIAQGTSLTLYWANGGTATSGSRTLTSYGIATILFNSATVAFITGSGLA